ncbi:MAG: hypothetical protein M0Q93_01685 [Terrimicrobiaceae bacterium]|nr:hypothetical protein [Terrimicrobiaceae bacterium]
MGVTATGRRRDDGKIVLTCEGIGGVVAVHRNAGLKPRDSWEDYPLGVAEMLARAGATPGGFDADFSANLPPGAGLSSSAALAVATAVLLARLFPFEIPPLELAKVCRRAENEFVGVSCGLPDQVSLIFGKKDHVIHLDCRAETVGLIPFPKDLGLLTVHSGVKHGSAAANTLSLLSTSRKKSLPNTTLPPDTPEKPSAASPAMAPSPPRAEAPESARKE